ncbi:HD domain-containing protein [Blastopirellula retiformator]|uniref:3'-5' exoribonuclease YhaM n=1 Tax=Blastopirellula retiformator TaxID=2527970 RepID=A0A5C5V025_9BACT|nr:HD domain-containing protein [Blastopirellula retiformator]TWT31761.1 3'-5' exoribonuclease YhaM [Blastopirellula retiformator]
MNNDPISIANTLADLQPGELGDVFVQLVGRDVGMARNGQPYVRLEFRDDRRRAQMMIWSDSQWFDACQNEWRPGEHFKIRAVYHESSRGKELRPNKIRPVCDKDHEQGFDPTRCQPRSSEDPTDLWDAAVTLCKFSIADESLRQLVETFYTEQRDKLLIAPAGLYHHHCYQGGLLEHLLSVAQTTIDLIERYRHSVPSLADPTTCDLAIAGALLHDVGKLLEIDLDQGGVARAIEGQILGHVLMGRDLVRDCGQQVGVAAELLIRLELIVLTHQDYYADGDYRRPISCEALLVQQADRIDSELHRYSAALDASTAGPVIPRDNPLGRPILRLSASPDAEVNGQP